MRVAIEPLYIAPAADRANSQSGPGSQDAQCPTWRTESTCTWPWSGPRPHPGRHRLRQSHRSAKNKIVAWNPVSLRCLNLKVRNIRFSIKGWRLRAASGTAGEHRPVGLHQSENGGRADAKRQHTVNGLERAHHLPMRLQRQPRGASRGHRIHRIKHCIPRRVERTQPQICSCPDCGLYSVQHSQKESGRRDQTNHYRDHIP